MKFIIATEYDNNIQLKLKSPFNMRNATFFLDQLFFILPKPILYASLDITICVKLYTTNLLIYLTI